ncbi:MAG: hypothetical protein IT260_08970, partial [Saprospiraceae bacterium]|nr:hypothetical protein [Saprospiraceae bacterium]
LRENPTREQLWQALYPGQPADQRQLNYLMSWLLKLGEQFLGLEHYQQQVFEPEWQTAEALLSRGLFKHYRFNAERLRRRLSASPLRNTAYLLQEYRFADLELRANSSQEISRQTDEHLQQASDQLDYFYLTEKLKYACTMLNNQNVVSSSYEFQFVEEVRRFVENHAFPATAPGIALYFRVYQMLVKENGDADFQALRQLLPLQKDRFSQEEMAWLYSYALNYCIRQIRHVREEFVAEALQLYEEGVESGVLLTDNGQLSPWHYKNIVKLGLRLQRFAWTEGFIREKNLLLAQESRSDALHFNLADLFFYTGRYAEAQQHLNQLEFSDVHYNLDAKEMLAKIYYETEAFDALDSLLHAFKSYLQRNRIITENVRKAYLNFIKWLRLLLRTTPDKHAALRLRIEKSDQVTAKNWLLEQTKSGKNQALS